MTANQVANEKSGKMKKIMSLLIAAVACMPCLMAEGVVPKGSNASDIADGVYYLRVAVNQNYVIALKAGSPAVGGGVQLMRFDGSDNQKWRVTHVGKALVLRSYSNHNLVLAQKGRINPNTERAELGLAKYAGAATQLWVPTVSDVQERYWLRMSNRRGYAIALNGTVDSNQPIQLCDYSMSANEMSNANWIFEPTEDGSTLSAEKSQCPLCDGTGFVGGQMCNFCQGRGWFYKYKNHPKY